MQPLRNVDKAVFLNAIVCRARGWYLRHHSGDQEDTAADQFRMQQGAEIGRRARLLFPGGALVGRSANRSAAEQTIDLMRDARVGTIFEATFNVGSLIAKADVLCRQSDGWHLIEVKSSLNEREDLVADLAYTALVIQLAGVKLVSTSLMLLSRDFRLGMSDDHLFAPLADKTSEVFSLLEEYEAVADSIQSDTARLAPPAAMLIRECKGCPYFEEACIGKGIMHHVTELPRLSEKKLMQLVALGIDTIKKVPSGFELTPTQRMVRDAVNAGKPVVVPEALEQLLQEVRWPAAYLDFETVTTAIPLYAGIAPFQQIPTQYSVHICDRPESEPEHLAYLADASRDCREELAANLVCDLSRSKSIVVYSPFEKRVLGELAECCPGSAKQLRECIDRLFDLEAAFRPGVYYHPAFRGRSSIKATLPAMIPSMSYEGMPIGDGDMAVAMFAKMAMGRANADETVNIREHLLEYCKQDTLAMVLLHAQLLKIASDNGNGSS